MAGKRFGGPFLLVGILVLAAPGVVLAGNDIWKAPVSGSFGDDARWLDGSAPTDTDLAVFNVVGAYDVLFDYDPVNEYLQVLGAGVDVTFSGDGGERVYSLTGAGGSGNIDIISGAKLTLGALGAPMVLLAGNSLQVVNGSLLYISHGSEISADGFRAGTVLTQDRIVVTESGSGLTVTGSGPHNIGWNGGRGSIAITNTANADIAGNLVLGGGVASNSQGFFSVSLGATASLGDLTVGTDGKTGQAGWVTVSGPGSQITQTGVSVLTLGTAANSTGELHMFDGGVFSSGMGAATVNATGRIYINASVFNANGDMDIYGELTCDSTGTFSPADGTTIRIIGGGSATFSEGYLLDAAATIEVIGHGASLDTTSGAIDITGGGTLWARSGGDISSTIGFIATGPDSSGEVTVDGGGSTWTNSGHLYVGGSGGTGELNVQAGGAVSNQNSYVGYTADSSSSVTVTGAGSTWTNALETHIGRSGTGSLEVAAGGIVSSMHGHVGSQGGSDGSVTVDGAGSRWTNTSTLTVGGWGSGSLVITNGGDVSSLGGSIGREAPSDGSVTVDGGGSTWTTTFADVTIGSYGSGTLNITNGGAASNAARVFVGYHADSNGSVTVSGVDSTWTNTNYLAIGHYGSGTMSIADGGTVLNDRGDIGANGGSSGAVTVDGAAANWINSGYLYVGFSGSGTLDVINGGAVSSLGAFLGAQADSDGAVTVSGAGSAWTNTNDLGVGQGGSGTLMITNGGTVSNVNAVIRSGSDFNSSAVVDGSGSTWTNSGGLVVGRNANSTLTITNGGVVSCTTGYISEGLNSNSSVTVSSAGSTWTNSVSLTVGKSGDGTLDITDGGVVLGADVFIGEQSTSDSIATVTGAGSTWTNSGELAVGASGRGALVISNGGTVSNTTGHVAWGSSPDSSASVDGAGSTWTNTDELYVGRTGTGTLEVTGGGAVSNTTGYAGYLAGSNGAVIVDGSGSTWTSANNLIVAYSGIGALDILNGGSVSSQTGQVGYDIDSDGHVTVDGSGSTWTNSDSLDVGGSGTGMLDITNGGTVHGNGTLGKLAGSNGTVTVSGSGSSWANSGRLTVGDEGGGVLSITSGGTVSSTECVIAGEPGSSGMVSVEGSGATWTNTADLSVGGGTGLVEIRPEGTVSIGGAMNLLPSGTVNLYGGTIRFGLADPIDFLGGSFGFYSGMVEFDRSMDINPVANGTLDDLFGSTMTIPTGKGLGVTGAATLLTEVNLTGGTLVVSDMANSHFLLFDSGTFRLTEADLSISPGGLFGWALTVSAGKTIDVTNTTMVASGGQLSIAGGHFAAGELVNFGHVELSNTPSLLSGATFTNHAFFGGDGTISAALNNTAAGEVRATAGERLAFTGSGNVNAGALIVDGGSIKVSQDLTNSGQINVDGGTFRTGGALANATAGTISGHGQATLRFDGGLDNSGLLAVAFADAWIYGNIVNNAAGLVSVAGQSNAAFIGDIVNSGNVYVGPGSTAVFLGHVSGAGDFPGGGTVEFVDGFSPGASPAEVIFGGNVAFAMSATLEIELGGTIAGNDHDVLDIAGNLSPGGAFQVVLIDDFEPQTGDTFDILDWDTLGAATFDTVELPELTGRKAWDTSNLYETGVISVIGMMVGDTDLDWDVDTDDFHALATVFGESGDWRTDFNEDGRVDLTDFTMLRGNFGAGAAPPGAPGDASETTPEPATIFIISAGAVLFLRKRRLRTP